MATNVSLNGNVYSIPAVGEDNWGQNLTDYFIAIPNAVLQKNGGNFTITADVNFGATYGLLAKYFSSRSGAATDGLLRLANLDFISWRNFANSGNLHLGVNSSDQLTFNGGVVTFGGITSLTGDVTASGPGAAVATIAANAITSAKILDGAVISSKILDDAVITSKILNNAVTNAKLAQVATGIFKARSTAGTGNVEDLTGSQATALLSNFVGDSGAGGVKGLVPAPASGDAAANKFLKADGTWTVAATPITPTSFAIANNQSSPADVTGFLVNAASHKSWQAAVYINRSYTGSYSLLSQFDDNLGAGFNNDVAAVAAQADNKFVVGGDFTQFKGAARKYLVRLNSDGSEDTTFYTNLGTGLDDVVADIAVQLDGKIVIAGNFTTLNGASAIGLARLNSDGTPDTTFNSNASVTSQSASMVFVQSDQKILSGATALTRYTTSGTVDGTFTPSTYSTPIAKMGQLSDNRLIVVGAFSTFNGVASRGGVVMLNANGTEDTAWHTAVGGNPNSQSHDVAVNPDDSVIITGQFTSFGGSTHNRIIKISGAGTVDATWYSNLGAGGLDATGYTVKVQPDLSVVIGGDFTSVGVTAVNRIAVLSAAGVPSAAFVTAIGTGADGTVLDTATNSVGVVLVGGQFTMLDGVSLVRAGALLNFEERITEMTLRGVYRPSLSGWELGGTTAVGDSTGVTFSMLASGQLQYVSTNITGTVITSLMKFLITEM